MSEEVVETAKAIQETAKTTGKAIDLVDGLGVWLGKVAGEPIAQAMAYHVTDKLQMKRLEAAIYDRARLMELARKVEARLEGKRLHVRPLLPKVSIPLLEAASLEYDENLHSLWANLLATAIDAEAEPVDRPFITILRDLSADDAAALAGLWEQSKGPHATHEIKDGLKTYGPSLDTTPWGGRVAANLHRLALIRASSVDFPISRPVNSGQGSGFYEIESDAISVPGNPDFVVFTDIGRAFCRAVGMT